MQNSRCAANSPRTALEIRATLACPSTRSRQGPTQPRRLAVRTNGARQLASCSGEEPSRHEGVVKLDELDETQLSSSASQHEVSVRNEVGAGKRTPVVNDASVVYIHPALGERLASEALRR